MVTAAPNAPRRADPLRGVMLMSAGALSVPVMDVIAKVLGSDMAPIHIAWGRFFFQIMLMLPLVMLTGGFATLRTARPLAHAMRGVLIAAATLCFFTALQYLPVADAIAIFFVEPLILTLIAAVFLGEGIGWRRLLAVVTGFIGALIVIGPKFDTIGVPALLPLGAAVFFACYMALTRALADDLTPLATQAVSGVSGLVVLTIAVLLGAGFGIEGSMPVAIDSTAWMLLVLLGVLATFGHLLIVQALHHAPASSLAPLQYLEIVSAVTLGLIVFGDFPTPRTWIGMVFIIGSGLFVFWRAGRAAAD